MTTILPPENGTDFIDHLYNLRQDGRLTDSDIAELYFRADISQWTYERLMSLKPTPKED